MIKRKDGRWQEQVKLPGMAKPKYFYGKTQKEVRRKMAEWSQAEEEAKTKAVLFETVADEWLNFKIEVDKVGWNTEHGYMPSLREAKDWFSGRNIGDIYADEIMDFLKSVAAKGLGFSAVSKRKNVMNGIFDYAILKRMIKYNPARSAKLPGNLPKGTREPPEDEQMDKVRAAFGGEGFGLFPLLQAFTGMRRAELLALRWEDFDWEKNLISVKHSVEFINGIPRVKTPKTDAGEREISLLEQLKRRLPRNKSGMIFKGKNGYMTANEYHRAWKRWCISAGLAEEKEQPEGKKKLRGLDKWRVTVTSHQLRHYYATILYEAGVGMKDMQDLLGHADIQTTLNVYTHIRKRQKKAATERLNQFLCQNDVENEESIDK